MTWLQEAMEALILTEEAEAYLLGRGAVRESFTELGEGTWITSPAPHPDPHFHKQYGPHGERLEGWLTCPIRTPRGEYIGFEARPVDQKIITRYLDFPRAYWVPIWIAHQDAAAKLWAGGSAWVVEGRFDLYAMEHVVPEADTVVCSVRGVMTQKHVEYFRRLGCHVNLVYDRDEQGRIGTENSLGWMRSSGVSCQEFPYVGGKDPGAIWDKQGLEGLKEAFLV